MSRGPRGVVAGDTTVQVRFSTPLAPLADSPAPRVEPSAPGRWSEPTPTTLQFTPAAAYLPGTAVTAIIPRGLRAADGARLRHPVKIKYRAAGGSPQRLIQLLAQLRYLPVHFISHHRVSPRDAAAQRRAVYAPPKGRLRFGHGWPARLHGLWAHNRSLVIGGAVRAFESQHGLTVDGVAGPQVWRALLSARVHSRFNTAGYTYAVASESSPETLTVYHNGRAVVRTPANTGVAGAPTALGTYPVYERLRSQTMQGTNLNGSHYADFVQWVAYFNGGDAVHYMPRSSYGYPQSLGCVELPYAAAKSAWGYLTYGTLVSVVG
ncbi:MAG TPA: L,D-transpeptidase family protein [Solirubrobacteraceae bacterium]|nr:L,D-transpeptidase family protein [Solirubrobacteraceae bacterium]